MLGYSRIPYAAALDGTFFRFFGKTHPSKDFPHRSLLLVGILSAIASLFDLVQIITALILARILVMFVGQIIGLLLLRKRHPEAPRPFACGCIPCPHCSPWAAGSISSWCKPSSPRAGSTCSTFWRSSSAELVSF
jgi:amino acid transporter